MEYQCTRSGQNLKRPNKHLLSLAILLVGLLTLGAKADVAGVHVSLALPEGAHRAGEIVEVPVYLEDGDHTVASYALQVTYSRKVLRVVEIVGGTFAGFSSPPLTNPASFSSGKTDFAANNDGFVETPDKFEAARIRFEVIGKPGKRGKVRLKPSRGGSVVALSGFKPMRVKLGRGGKLTVAEAE